MNELKLNPIAYLKLRAADFSITMEAALKLLHAALYLEATTKAENLARPEAI